MTNKVNYNAYNHANGTVNGVQQVIMLYDGAINFIKQAKEAINEKNWEKRYNLINKAIAIVTGLNSCLEFNEKTEETAKALDNFYSSIDMRLLTIQCDTTEKSLVSCDEVISSLKTMREAWVDVAEKTSADFAEPDQGADNIEFSFEKQAADVSANIITPAIGISQEELQITV